MRETMMESKMGEYAYTCHSFHIQDVPICPQGYLQLFHLQQPAKEATLILIKVVRMVQIQQKGLRSLLYCL